MKIGGYFAATAMQAGGSFAIVALLVRLLGPYQFGRWSLLEPVLLLGAQLVLMGTSWGIVKLVAQDNYGLRRSLKLILSRVGLPSVLIAAIVAAALGLWQGLGLWAVVAALFLLTEAAVALMLSACRGANFVQGYVAGVSIRVALNLALLLLCWWGGLRLITTAEHVLVWWTVSSAVAIGFLSFLIRSQPRYDSIAGELSPATAYRSALSYGAPILLAAALAAVVGNADRYVLALHADAAVVGHYVVLGKIASALNLLVTPVNLWWPTARFQHIKDSDGGEAFFRSSTVLLCGIFSSAAGTIFICAPAILKYISPNSPFDVVVVAALCGASFCIAMSAPMNVGMLKEGKTFWSVVTVGSAATLQLLLAFWWVPIHGIRGAAFATLLSSIGSLFFQNLLSQRIHRIRFDYGTLVALAGYCATVSAICSAPSVNLQLSLRMVIFLLTLVPPALWLRYRTSRWEQYKND